MVTATQTITLTILTITLLGGAFLYFSGPLKTLWLIARISPYEQSIANAPTMLILGDSTGYGTGASNASDSIAGLIGADFVVTIQNNSKNGRTIGELVPKIGDFDNKYVLVLLQIGANDILQKRNLSAVEAELRVLISTLSPHTDHIVMMPSGNVGASPRFSGAEAQTYEQLSLEFRAMFMRVASDTKLTYVDLFKQIEGDPFAQDPRKYVAIDGLHPSSAGYRKWYETLYPEIETRLQTHKAAIN